MFKLLYLKLHEHPQLNDIEISFVENNEIKNERQPYTTIIIGPNGSGKSFLLKAIGEIFRYHRSMQDKNSVKKSAPLFQYHLRYQYDHDVYDIIAMKVLQVNANGEVSNKKAKRSNLYLKNHPFEIINLRRKTLATTDDMGVLIEKIDFPKSVLVSSYLVNDRFVWSDSKENDFYQYLGIRNTSNSTNTASFAKKTIRFIIESLQSSDFSIILSNLLEYLGFEKSFRISYRTRYNELFFSGNVDEIKIDQFYTQWWKSSFTKRKEESIPYSKARYDNIKKNHPEKIASLIDYLNNSLTQPDKLLKINRSSAKLIEIDIFDKNLNVDEFNHIQLLQDLDAVVLEKIDIRKINSTKFSIADSSAGEYHLILSLLGLYSRIKQNSLVLLDEPEISLHPNWQMRYIHFLKEMFKKYGNCHFLIATHSHFLVSDLEGDSSAVVALTKNLQSNCIVADLLEGKNTYGWSAEEVLYTIFRVRSTRNSYMEYDLTKLLTLINKNSEEYSEIRNLLEKIKKVDLSESDPLTIIIEKTEKYLKDNNAQN